MSARPILRKRNPSELPGWLGRAERLVAEAVRTVRLLGSVVPRNAVQERERLLAVYEGGQSAMPRWTYARTDHSRLRRALARATERLRAEPHPVAQLYAARVSELEIEAALASEVGTSVLGALARARFGSQSHEAAGEATILARKWIAEGRDAPPNTEGAMPSDAATKGSLLTRMREEVSRLGLPFAVVVQPSLVSLAATGERHILVTKGRLVASEDVERTVMHEIEAHAIPRARAARARLAIFQIGTARGVDDQEGLALVLEERHGYSTARRKRELAARHLAVEAMDGRATFVDAARALIKEHGLTPRESVLVCERAFRGGDGTTAGLGRERIYLEAFLRVKAHLAESPTDEGILTSGQVSLDAITLLRPFTEGLHASHP
jgi:hypothetical protein